jgi:hypothetical protein
MRLERPSQPGFSVFEKKRLISDVDPEEPNLEYGICPDQLAPNSNVFCTNADPMIKTRDRSSRFTHRGEHVSGLAGEAFMLCMEPLCVRMMQLASFTLSFT